MSATAKALNRYWVGVYRIADPGPPKTSTNLSSPLANDSDEDESQEDYEEEISPVDTYSDGGAGIFVVYDRRDPRNSGKFALLYEHGEIRSVGCYQKDQYRNNLRPLRDDEKHVVEEMIASYKHALIYYDNEEWLREVAVEELYAANAGTAIAVAHDSAFHSDSEEWGNDLDDRESDFWESEFGGPDDDLADRE